MPDLQQCVIDPNDKNYPYDDATFALISTLADDIKRYSARHGVPPIAVAGSIADEYNIQRGARKIWDWLQDRIVFTRMPASWIGRDFKIGFKSRLLNATRNLVRETSTSRLRGRCISSTAKNSQTISMTGTNS
jgi:hypothetical protein